MRAIVFDRKCDRSFIVLLVTERSRRVEVCYTIFQEYLRALIPMNTQLMVKPSSLMPQGIKMVEFGNIYLFRFTDELQSRMEELLEIKKVDLLTADETPELAGIIELSGIFTLINAQLSTQAKWCPIALDNLYDNELNISANTVTLQYNKLL